MNPESPFLTEILRTGPDSFVAVHPRTGEHVTMTGEERFLVEQLRRGASREDLCAAHARRFGRRLSADQADAFRARAVGLGLLAPAEDDAGRLGHSSDATAENGTSVNAFFDVAVLGLGWLVHPWMVAPTLGLLVFALLGLGRHGGVYLEELAALRQSMSMLPFLAAVVVCAQLCIFLPRAFLLGVACRKHRGRIVRFSVRLVRGVFPVIVCDIGDSIGLMARRAQWVLLTVGWWTQVAVFSAATLIWTAADPGGLPRALSALVMLPAAVTLLLQLVLTLPRDGYFLLCFLLEEPRLRERAAAETRAWLWARVSPEPLTRRERFWLRAFGVGMILTRFAGYALVAGVGGYLVCTYHHGDGFLVFSALFLGWMYPSVEGTIMSIVPGSWRVRFGGSRVFRWGVRLVLLGVVLLAGFLPYTYDVVGECRVLPGAQQGVRALVGGEIAAVHVQAGDTVAAGDPIVTLDDRDVRAALDSMRAEFARGQANLELLRSGARPEEIEIRQQRLELAALRASYLHREFQRVSDLHEAGAATEQQLLLAEQELESARRMEQLSAEALALLKTGARPEQITAAEAEVEALQARLGYLERQLSLLEVKAPIAGVVLTPHMSQRLGQVVVEGDLIAVVKDQADPTIEIAAKDTAAALVNTGMPVNVRLFSLEGRLLEGMVTDVLQEVETAGGFLTEPVRSDRERFMQTSVSRPAQSRSRVRVHAEVRAEPGELRPGMTGYARIAVSREYFWRVLFRRINRFLRTEVWSWLP